VGVRFFRLTVSAAGAASRNARHSAAVPSGTTGVTKPAWAAPPVKMLRNRELVAALVRTPPSRSWLIVGAPSVAISSWYLGSQDRYADKLDIPVGQSRDSALGEPLFRGGVSHCSVAG